MLYPSLLDASPGNLTIFSDLFTRLSPTYAISTFAGNTPLCCVIFTHSIIYAPDRTKKKERERQRSKQGKDENTLPLLSKMKDQHSSSCPKCGASFSGDSKTCGSCGATCPQ
ncbi:hypothetical protein F4778DRAFT_462788 [Xylariomycetidae sp. FL2044]|nr:hypothetical protein F4778DRAFT_462788 [Xylariomycetidae sp. FL2044]